MSDTTADPDEGKADADRLDRHLTRAGVCSRRDVKTLVTEGRVAINGRKPDSAGAAVEPGDIVTVDGQPVAKAEQTRLWRYHKPAGLVTTHKDPQGRPTVFERLPEELPRVISIGRLDLNTEGLLLLTNDGALARRLELPATGWLRRYRVRVHGEVQPEQLVALEKGVRIDGVDYGSIKALLDRQQGSNAWLTVALREGRNREIRRVMQHFGWPVNRLIRVAYGPFQLGQLAAGAVEEVPPKVMRDQLGGSKESGGKESGGKESGGKEKGRRNSREPAKRETRRRTP